MKIKLLVMLVAIVICLGSVQRLTGQAPFVDQAPPRFDSGWLEHTRFALPDSSWASAKSIVRDACYGRCDFRTEHVRHHRLDARHGQGHDEWIHQPGS